MSTKVQISKADKGDGQKKKIFRLTEIDPEFVSLVRAGANRQSSFQVVKEDDPEAQKQVPEAGADPDEKRAAQEQRATKYGIEAREDGNLSYQKDDPTTEAMYGDPVNLKYPFGMSDNEPDSGRLRNALSRFSQARDEYEKKASQVKILARIIEASLKAGIDVSYQEGDEIYEALPNDLKERIKSKDDTDKGDKGDDADGGSTDGSETDLSSWLDEAGATVETLSLDHAIQAALDGQSDGQPEVSPTASSKANEIGMTGAPPVEKVGEEAGEEDPRDVRIAELESRLKKQKLALSKAKADAIRLKKSVGQTSVLATGEVSTSESQQSDIDESPSRGAFKSGNDIAAAVVGRG